MTPTGRLIISAANSHMEKISTFVDHFLNPCAQNAILYIRIHAKNNVKFNGEPNQHPAMPTNFVGKLRMTSCTLTKLRHFSGKDTLMIAFSFGQEQRTALMSSLTTWKAVTQNFTVTFEKLQHSIPFLDTTVVLAINELKTDLYSKPTDSHNYPLFTSFHPNKCMESILYSQYLRMRCICSRLSDFDKHVTNMTLDFEDRGYPIHLDLRIALSSTCLSIFDWTSVPCGQVIAHTEVHLTNQFHFT